MQELNDTQALMLELCGIEDANTAEVSVLNNPKQYLITKQTEELKSFLKERGASPETIDVVMQHITVLDYLKSLA